MHDTDKTLGVGLAIGWDDCKYLQVNTRTDGRWNIINNGTEAQIDGCVKAKPAIVAFKLSDKTIQLYFKNLDAEWAFHTQFPRTYFPQSTCYHSRWKNRPPKD